MAATQAENLLFRQGCWKKPSPVPSQPWGLCCQHSQSRVLGNPAGAAQGRSLSTQPLMNKGLQRLQRLEPARPEPEGAACPQSMGSGLSDYHL